MTFISKSEKDARMRQQTILPEIWKTNTRATNSERMSERRNAHIFSVVVRSLLCIHVNTTNERCSSVVGLCLLLPLHITFVGYLFATRLWFLSKKKYILLLLLLQNSTHSFSLTHKQSSYVFKYYSMLLPYFSGWCYVSRFVSAYSLETQWYPYQLCIVFD